MFWRSTGYHVVLRRYPVAVGMWYLRRCRYLSFMRARTNLMRRAPYTEIGVDCSIGELMPISIFRPTSLRALTFTALLRESAPMSVENGSL